MNKKNMFALLTALALLTASAGCGAKEMTETTDAPIVAEKSNGEAVMNDAAGAPAEAGEAADDAAPAAAPAAVDEGAYAEAEYDMAAGDADFAYGADAKLTARTAGSPVLNGEFGAVDGAEVADDVLTAEPMPAAGEVGVLTAGEWRDHDNWGFFANLVNTGTIAFPSFGIDPTHRVEVTVHDAAGTALPNADVVLTQEDGGVLWTAKTDKNGVAYLFEGAGTGTSVTVTAPDGATATETLPPLAADTQSETPLCTSRSAEITLESAPVLAPDMQVMFIVDTTGSMGDEMMYLQSDFTALTEEIEGETAYSVLFYKDEGDDYVTRSSGDFTSDTAEIKRALAAEYASGGGDEPEAVAQALTAAFIDQHWSEDAVKVAFLIYDAPPHDGTEEDLQAAIGTAAEMGIHLVPVVSSNGSRETELFGRAAAICTNGSYVFLTDDSGVGGSHLEPIIGDHEVELLHDIIVRIVNDYRQ